MAAIKRPRETRNGRFWMLIELKKSCIGESDAGNQTRYTATKPRNARQMDDSSASQPSLAQTPDSLGHASTIPPDAGEKMQRAAHAGSASTGAISLQAKAYW